MLRVNQIKVPVSFNGSLDDELRKKTAAKLGISPSKINELIIFKRSIDARKDIFYVYSVDVTVENENKIRKNKDVIPVERNIYSFPYKSEGNAQRPVIVGMGPAGLFCGLMLARAGFRPLIIERGKCIEERTQDVKHFWKTGQLKPESNVQFGEGGAGAFSDGKLNTVVKDKSGKNRAVLEIFVNHGAAKDILYDNKPHVGTDVLFKVVKSIRDEIISLGGEVRFDSKVTRLIIKDSTIKGIYLGEERIDCENLVLAIGHSSRDTFETLKEAGVPMEPKPFAVGFRVSHPQNVIDIAMYGPDYEKYGLPAAPYKLTYNADDKRGVYSFCMCPGGYVVNASSEADMTAVNGMSYADRASGCANSAIVVSVNPDDFPGNDVLKGMYYQRDLEKKAYELGEGKIPIQKYGEFKDKVIPGLERSCNFESVLAYKGEVKYSDLTGVLSQRLNEDIVNGMEHFGKILKDFNDDNALMAGVESRTSSPVRINRDENGQSVIKGLYPCGEGAGYAGGITSAAIDGIYIAECVAKKINKSGK